MPTKSIATGIAGTLLGVAFGVTLTPTNVNPLILQDNVEQHSRLKQPPVWDTSVVSSTEITDAYIAVATKYGVTTDDLTASGGNLQTAIQVKMAAMLLLCDNANTSKL